MSNSCHLSQSCLYAQHGSELCSRSSSGWVLCAKLCAFVICVPVCCVYAGLTLHLDSLDIKQPAALYQQPGTVGNVSSFGLVARDECSAACALVSSYTRFWHKSGWFCDVTVSIFLRPSSALRWSRELLQLVQLHLTLCIALLAPCVFPQVLVAPTAKIGADCKLGPDVSIGEGCVIGDGVRLSNCVIMRGVTVGHHTKVSCGAATTVLVLLRVCLVQERMLSTVPAQLAATHPSCRQTRQLLLADPASCLTAC